MQRSRLFGEVVQLDSTAGEARETGPEGLADYIEDVLLPFIIQEQLAAAIEEAEKWTRQ